MYLMLVLAAALGADAKEDLLAAIKKLAEAPNYSWTSTPKSNAAAPEGQGARRGPGPGEGRTEKDGFTWLSTKQGETATEAFLKGDKAVIKAGAEWKASSEFQRAPGAGGQQGRPDPAAGMARALRAWKSPAATAEGLASKSMEIKAEADGLYSAELTEEGAKELLVGGGRPGGQGPQASDVKGAVKFWVKDGALVKFEHTVSGKMKFGEREMNIDRTTTVEIKDVGTTKVEIPEEAKSKL